MKEALKNARTQGESDIPDRLKSESEARAYYRFILQEFSDEVIQGVAATEISADIALKINEIITRLKKRDWVQDLNVKNQMKNEIEDYLFSIKGRYDLKWDLDVIDRILEENIRVAESREIQN